jgi:hypothetical protein
MAEVVGLLAGFAVLAAVAYGFYMGGRDGAERRAFYTISELRREVRVERLEADRLRERLNRIQRGDAQRIRGA